MNFSNVFKVQLDLIVSTCDQESEISNKQIKQMLSILASSVQAEHDENNGRIIFLSRFIRLEGQKLDECYQVLDWWVEGSYDQ